MFQPAAKIVDVQQTEKTSPENKEKARLEEFDRSKYANKINDESCNGHIFI